MLKMLTKSGSSKVLVISKDMLAHLGIEEDRIDVRYGENQIILSRPLEESPDRRISRSGGSERGGWRGLNFTAWHKYSIKVEYYANGITPSVMKLYCESAHQQKEYIPQSCLFYPTGH
jgi:antitoxin component of MazEF toxin-antitoxin module